MMLKTVATGLLIAIAVSAPAAAKPRRHVAPACVDTPTVFSWHRFFFAPAPQANGCAPAVYEGGRYVGQDPDPNVRLQLRRDSGNEGPDMMGVR
jgi:hypothetical protein